MGAKKMKISDVSRETGLNRSTVTALYQESAKRIEVEAINELCKLFQCEVPSFLNTSPMTAREGY